MMQHIQQELANPLQCRRLLNIDIRDHFVRDSTHKTVSLKDLVKFVGVNWDNIVPPVENTSAAAISFDIRGGVVRRTIECSVHCVL